MEIGLPCPDGSLGYNARTEPTCRPGGLETLLKAAQLREGLRPPGQGLPSRRRIGRRIERSSIPMPAPGQAHEGVITPERRRSGSFDGGAPGERGSERGANRRYVSMRARYTWRTIRSYPDLLR